MSNGLIGKYILDIVLALAISAVATAALIPFLHKLKFGQQIREEGPQAHLKKAGTPTMGGIGFLLAILVCGIIFLVVSRDVRMVPVLLLTLLFGLIGFIDDFLKIVKKQSEGLNPKQKLLLQVAVSVAFIIILYAFGLGSSLRIPFLGREVHIPAPIFIFIALCAILGTDNAVNFTDGLDGLCSTVTVFTSLFFAIASIRIHGGVEFVCFAGVGALIGFLIFNRHPAKVFMGDTGSLALGGLIAGSALMLRMPLYILIVGLIYLIEILSVVIQVAYFKKTGGKRIFRMTPIHHHFELGGWSENKVVAVFSGITLILCVIGTLAT